MKIGLVAEKDFRDAIRNRELHVTLALFLAVGLGMGYFLSEGGGSTQLIVMSLGVIFAFVLPMAALGTSQGSLVTKRARGELTVLLGLPLTRADVVLGTFVGRTGLVLTAVATATVSSAVVATVRGVRIGVFQYGLAFLAMAMLGVAFVAIAVGISAASRDPSRSAVAAFGVFLLFVFRGWDLLPGGVAYVFNGFSSPSSTPEWVTAVTQIDPITAYGNVVAGVTDVPRMTLSILGVRTGDFSGKVVDVAAYEQTWFALAVLVAWVVVPLFAGYRLFEAADL